ncbi:outer membrane protein assembly factor [Nitrosococcus wardiae]|uniref:Translocation and assembly module subunit TamA n=2 Tax=Nitrosococcus wardiae TaxID=1814290 RepID=A0A4P7C3R6_9GAMM|nr:outer membrane protein assembly factor [Nitrosococcus wardiae]
MFQRILFGFLLLFLGIGSAWSQARLEVEVQGVEGKALENVMAYLSIVHHQEDPQLTEEQIHRLHDKVVDEVQTALEVYGYYRPQIQADLQQYPGQWLARYWIDPGPRMSVEEVNLNLTGEGRDDPAFQALQEDFPVKKKNPLNHADYEQGKAALQQLAAERGYFQAEFTQQKLQVNLEAYVATVVLHFSTGPRYRFGPVTFSETVVRPQLLARYVPFEEGELYESSDLIELHTALVDSNYFAEVEVEPQPQQAVDKKVPIEVRLQAVKRHRYSAGVGFGTDTGPRINLGWENRYVNRRGHRFGFALRASGIRQAFDTSYVIPIRDPRTDQLAIASSFGRESTRTSDSRIAQLGVRRVTARGDWRETLSLNYRWEDFEIDGESGTAKLLIPGVIWFRSQADDPIYPRRGHRISLELRGAAQELLSNNTFSQFTLRGKMVRSPGSRSRVLVRGALGMSLVSDFSELPPSVRYFAGGDQSVRGYAFNTLGAKDDEDRVVGGRNLFVGSLEYEYRLLDKWAVATFYDAGNAFNDFSLDLQQGAGVGIRWISPVGPIRVDLAWALSKPGTPFRLHVYLGPDL